MAILSAHRRAMIWNALRNLLAAAAMSAVARAAVNQGQRGDLTRKARLGVQAMVRRALLSLLGGLFFMVAAGFLVAAIYLGLREAFIAPIAALLAGLLLTAAGAGVLFLGRRKAVQELEEEAPAAAEQIEDRPATDMLLEFIQDMVKNAGKNLGLVVATLFLIGLWFGFGRDKLPDDESEEADSSQGRDDDSHHDGDAATAPPVREQSAPDTVNRQRADVY